MDMNLDIPLWSGAGAAASHNAPATDQVPLSPSPRGRPTAAPPSFSRSLRAVTARTTAASANEGVRLGDSQRRTNVMPRKVLILVFLITVVAAVPAAAQVTAYTDEALFLADVAALGWCVDLESFESDAAWGGARSPATLPLVTSLGITWLPNNANSELTTGSGPARTGLWGFYELPHGDFGSGIGDGWFTQAADTLYAVGGWLVSNTPGARINLVLDGAKVVDFGGNNAVGTSHSFFGVIDPAGFAEVEFRETEGSSGDPKYVFGDDFSFGRVSCYSAIFGDGFESGDTSAWSVVVP